MSLPDEIHTEVAAISAVIRDALGILGTEGLVDVSPIESRVHRLCSSLDKVRAGDGAALRPCILALIDEFSELGVMMEVRLESLRGKLHSTGGRAEALSAYGQAAHSGKPKS